jgi:hypothetical protein
MTTYEEALGRLMRKPDQWGWGESESACVWFFGDRTKDHVRVVEHDHTPRYTVSLLKLSGDNRWTVLATSPASQRVEAAALVVSYEDGER